MYEEKLRSLLGKVAGGAVEVEAAVEELRTLPFADLGFAKIDHHRELRVGAPEVIFCQGKTPEQISAIAAEMLLRGGLVLATRADHAAYEAILRVAPYAEYLSEGRIVRIKSGGAAHLASAEGPTPPAVGSVTLAGEAILPGEATVRGKATVMVLTAGTSDLPVAYEALYTAESLGVDAAMIADVGVAGPQRLFAHLDEVRGSAVVIAVAGMEGALASMVAGLVSVPVIACPTSVGYGAGFGGLAALLSMLSSCAPGVGVVNIDNGFGAGYLAAQIAGAMNA